MAYNGVTVKHIVATDLNGCIGKDGKMPWHIPADLKRFRELTEGGVVIMGRKTFESLGCKPLPNRCNIIISSNDNLLDEPYVSCYVFPTIDTAISNASYWAHGARLDTIWIIGGAEIYAQTMQYVDVIEHTMVYAETTDGDTWYNYEPSEFKEVNRSAYLKDKDSSHAYRYLTWERKANG